MEIQAKSVDRKLLLRFSGELDHHGAKTAIREMEEAVESALPLQLVLDFSGVTFMDSAGIAVALRGWQRMRELGGCVKLQHVASQPKKVLEAAGVGRMMTIQ